MSDRVSKHIHCAEFCIPAVVEVDVVCTVSIDVYSYVAPILNAGKGQTACQLSMHRRAVAGVVPSECMSATCFFRCICVSVHM